MTRTTSRRPAGRRPAALVPVVLAPLAVLLLWLLAACGGSTGAGTSTPNDQPANQAGNGAGRNGGVQPGVTGKIAEATKGTLQVQDTSSQTTVTYTASTRFSQTVSAKVAVGDCVTAVGAPVTGSTDALTANTIMIFAPQSGSCTLGAGRQGGGAGTRPSGAPGFPGGTPPSGVPGNGNGPGNGAGNGTGNGGQGRQNFATAFGKVTAVSGTTVTISGTLREGGRFGGNGMPTATPTATPSAPPAVPVTITLTGTTTVDKTVAATSAAAVVGKCASAFGKADSSGTVAATSITISSPGPNGCTRFGGFGGRGQGGFGGPGTSGQGGTGGG